MKVKIVGKGLDVSCVCLTWRHVRVAWVSMRQPLKRSMLYSCRKRFGLQRLKLAW